MHWKIELRQSRLGVTAGQHKGATAFIWVVLSTSEEHIKISHSGKHMRDIQPWQYRRSAKNRKVSQSTGAHYALITGASALEIMPATHWRWLSSQNFKKHWRQKTEGRFRQIIFNSIILWIHTLEDFVQNTRPDTCCLFSHDSEAAISQNLTDNLHDQTSAGRPCCRCV